MITKIKRLDSVILKKHPDPNDPDHMARVEEVDNKNKRVMITNMNMPFMGSYSLTWLSFDDVEQVPKRKYR